MGVAIQRELPSPQIGFKLVTPSGLKNRLGEDEPRAENVLTDVQITTEMPGGYKELSGTLGRDPQRTWLDLEPYTDIEAYMPGVGIIFQGSLDKGPGVSGDERSITPSFLGYQAIFEDNQAAQLGIINTDISGFGDPSTQRKLNLNKENYSFMADVSIGAQEAGSAVPCILFDFTVINPASGTYHEGQEVVWYGGGVDIGKVIFDQIGDNTTTWVKYCLLAKDDIYSAYDASPNYNGFPESLNQGIGSGIAGRKYVVFQAFYTNNAYTGGMSNILRWQNIKILGNHGLPYVGTFPNIGYTTKQILEYAVPTIAAPLTVDPNYIDEDGYVITQAWYPEPGPSANIIHDVTKYSLYDWFVYHDKRFELRKPGSYGRFWKALVAPSQLNEVGIDSQRLWRYIVVSYQDIDGSTRTVGPVGSGCNFESASLEITDPTHPAVQANRTRKDILDLGGVATASTAIAVGKRFLEEANLINRSGSATLSGYVLDQNGVMWPVAAVKSGDWISFSDAADKGYRKIIGTTYQHNEVSNEIELDAPASGLEALLERLQAGLISLGVS